MPALICRRTAVLTQTHKPLVAFCEDFATIREFWLASGSGPGVSFLDDLRFALFGGVLSCPELVSWGLAERETATNPSEECKRNPRKAQGTLSTCCRGFFLRASQVWGHRGAVCHGAFCGPRMIYASLAGDIVNGEGQ